MEIGIIFKIAGIGMITAVLAIILKKSDKDEIATFVTITGLVIVLFFVLDMVANLFDSLKSLLNIY